MCEEGEASEAEYSGCMGYILGWQDAQELLKPYKLGRFCVPQGMKPNFLAPIFLAQMREHPEFLQLPAHQSFPWALQRVYPCEKEG